MDDILELSIYGDIEPDTHDFWSDEIIPSETSARHFKEVLEAHPTVKEIHLFINSMGGSVVEGTAIYTLLKRHPAKVTVSIDAFACSMASGIAMAGDYITMSPAAVLMIHNPWTIACGNSVQLHKAAEDLEVMGEAFRQMYLLKAGDKLSEKKLIELLDAESYLTAQQALDLGLCDEIEFASQEEKQIFDLSRQVEDLKAQLKEESKPAEKKKGWFF